MIRTVLLNNRSLLNIDKNGSGNKYSLFTDGPIGTPRWRHVSHCSSWILLILLYSSQEERAVLRILHLRTYIESWRLSISNREPAILLSVVTYALSSFAVRCQNRKKFGLIVCFAKLWEEVFVATHLITIDELMLASFSFLAWAAPPGGVGGTMSPSLLWHVPRRGYNKIQIQLHILISLGLRVHKRSVSNFFSHRNRWNEKWLLSH